MDINSMKLIDFKRNEHEHSITLYFGIKTDDWGWTNKDYRDCDGEVPDWLKPSNIYKGDDWDNVPYECNAGKVYDEFIIDKVDVVVPCSYEIVCPHDGHLNSPYCKNDFVDGKVPCAVIIYPKYSGESYDDCVKADGEHGLIIRHGDDRNDLLDRLEVQGCTIGHAKGRMATEPHTMRAVDVMTDIMMTKVRTTIRLSHAKDVGKEEMNDQIDNILIVWSSAIMRLFTDYSDFGKESSRYPTEEEYAKYAHLCDDKDVSLYNMLDFYDPIDEKFESIPIFQSDYGQCYMVLHDSSDDVLVGCGTYNMDFAGQAISTYLMRKGKSFANEALSDYLSHKK